MMSTDNLYPNDIGNISKYMRVAGMLLYRDTFIKAIKVDSKANSVLMAQAAETLIKARIADKDYRKIFSTPQKAYTSLQDFLYDAKSAQYSKLPGLLENVLGEGEGLNDEQKEHFKKLGIVRNQIVHLSVSFDESTGKDALKYADYLLDPLCKKFWGYSVIDFIDNDPHLEMMSGITIGLEYSTKRERERILEKCEENLTLRSLFTSEGESWETFKFGLNQRVEDLKYPYDEYDGEDPFLEMQKSHEDSIKQKKSDEWESYLGEFQAVNPEQ